MTLSVLMYALMMATFVALAGVLVLDAVAAVRRRSGLQTGPARRFGAAAAGRRERASPARSDHAVLNNAGDAAASTSPRIPLEAFRFLTNGVRCQQRRRCFMLWSSRCDMTTSRVPPGPHRD